MCRIDFRRGRSAFLPLNFSGCERNSRPDKQGLNMLMPLPVCIESEQADGNPPRLQDSAKFRTNSVERVAGARMGAAAVPGKTTAWDGGDGIDGNRSDAGEHAVRSHPT